jgi:predicted nucleic acid-binding protein
VQTAVLDACVLFRNGVRDFLLWVAEAGSFTPAWSDKIHEEWMRNRHAKFGDPMELINRARTKMETAFPGANFPPDSSILEMVSLPDPDDVHVVATAVSAEAGIIVTYNESDFPDEILAQFGLTKQTPDDFCARIFDERQIEFIEGVRLHRASLKRPQYDQVQYLEHVQSGLELRVTAGLLRPFTSLI